MNDQSDDDIMLDHCAAECMSAIENKDKEAFMDAFHVLVSDIVNKMQTKDEES